MHTAKLQAYLDAITAARTLGLSLLRADESGVALHLPKLGNENHHDTLFGGSLALAATLCGWCQVALSYPNTDGNIVIKSSQMRYIAPATADVRVLSHPPDAAAHTKAQAMLARFSKASLSVDCVLYAADVVAAEFTGVFAIYIKPAQA